MKSITALLSLLAIAPSALALGTCHTDSRYCGSWLINHDGFTLEDLMAAHHGPNVNPYPPPSYEDSLYMCGRNNEIEYIEFCWEHCHETGPNGPNDFCEIGF